MSGNAIEVRGLRKSYGDNEAVRGVDLDVASGEVFALLGPNGAGKTTICEILEGHRLRTSGEASVLGFDPGKHDRSFKERIGIVLQETGVEPYLTVAEAIDLYRSYYPSPLALGDIIEVVGLTEQRDQRVKKLSGGQKRRLDVGIGLSGNPDLLFLDEPTTGFDPSARRQAWEMIRNLRSLGKTVFLTTHYMDEAQMLSDRVAVIAKGLIVAEGPPASLAGRDTGETTITFKTPDRALPKALGAGTSITDGLITIRTPSPTKTLNELTSWALKNKVDLAELNVARPTLEDVYLQLTGAESQ
ncbi:MAG: ABC transporter ATP-binding protein [Actinomycetota bacterium]